MRRNKGSRTRINILEKCTTLVKLAQVCTRHVNMYCKDKYPSISKIYGTQTQLHTARFSLISSMWGCFTLHIITAIYSYKMVTVN